MTDTIPNDATALADRYISAWNETDAGRRRALLERTWTAAASYVDPLMRGDGHDGIDAMIAAVQASYPGHRFRRTGPVDAHNGRIRFTWSLGPETGAPLADGTDFGTVAADGRLEAMVGFLDRVAAPPSS